MESVILNMTANSRPHTSGDASASLHPNQIAVAAELSLDLTSLDSAEKAVEAIVVKLGKRAVEERARWFVLSVLRHLHRAKWSEPTGSGLDAARQNGLAMDCLAVEGFSTSLATVTKDARSQYRMVGFASSKKIERGVLATGTKAYKIASQVIIEAGLVGEQAERAAKKLPVATKNAETPPSDPKEVEKTVVGRRAKRRGYFEDEFMNVANSAAVRPNKNQAVSMSEEEFADLDAALNKSDAEIVQQNWGDQQNEDRWSRILGLLAGVGFFVFVALLFL